MICGSFAVRYWYVYVPGPVRAVPLMTAPLTLIEVVTPSVAGSLVQSLERSINLCGTNAPMGFSFVHSPSVPSTVKLRRHQR